MKYLDFDGIGTVSRIGLGTWQFGSREGLGKSEKILGEALGDERATVA